MRKQVFVKALQALALPRSQHAEFRQAAEYPIIELFYEARMGIDIAIGEVDAEGRVLLKVGVGRAQRCGRPGQFDSQGLLISKKGINTAALQQLQQLPGVAHQRVNAITMLLQPLHLVTPADTGDPQA